MNKKIAFALLILLGWMSVLAPFCFAKRVLIPVTGKVNSFGTYSFIGSVEFDVKKPGEQEIGAITVEGAYNGEYPWIMRIYTDNNIYSGISGAVKAQNPAGLVSIDGRFVIPLFVNAPNMDIHYKAVPDINQNNYKPYSPARLNAPAKYADCVIMGVDPRNEYWVAGDNGILFDEDDNAVGDITAPTPFDLKFKAGFDERAVASNYTANLYIEIVACP